MSDQRIRPPAELVYVVDALMKGKLFHSKYEVLAFAAALGARTGSAKRLGKVGEGVRQDLFENNGLDLVWDVVAVAKEGDLRLAGADRTNERIAYFEECAYGGLELLRDECFEGASDVLEGLMRLVRRHAMQPDEPEVSDLF